MLLVFFNIIQLGVGVLGDFFMFPSSLKPTHADHGHQVAAIAGALWALMVGVKWMQHLNRVF